jgi:hypothetical protein
VYTWGLNNYGQLGLADFETRWFPERIVKDSTGYLLKPILTVECSSYATFIIDDIGRLFSFGKGYIGHGGQGIEKIPKKLDINTTNRIFTHLKTNDKGLLAFAPLRIHSVSPNCGPATGGTTLCLIGTAFTSGTDLKVRFRFSDLILEEPGVFYHETSSISVRTPNFLDGEELELPLEVSIDITMDGENYIQCEEKYYVYSPDLKPTSIFPKSASIKGGTLLSIDMPLDLPESHLFHIVCRFQNKTKRFPYEG